ncbi:hypothetical protein EVAR_33810_1 [Eumeta japonica]|uniref:Uncharacterized protein n=1 Tax=Eumeta variegata TaxID=151549 RepID=A0A4C1V9P0_EUMVA|nr:hypothetical protein EVAR_33810_1 [Eumeta japonica]
MTQFDYSFHESRSSVSESFGGPLFFSSSDIMVVIQEDLLRRVLLIQEKPISSGGPSYFGDGTKTLKIISEGKTESGSRRVRTPVPPPGIQTWGYAGIPPDYFYEYYDTHEDNYKE